MLKRDAVKTIKINFPPADFIKESDYIKVKRIFNDKDKIEIKVDTSLHLVPLKGRGDFVVVMFGNLLLAQISTPGTLKGISNHNINQVFVHSKKEQLEFTAEDAEDNEMKFIPLYRVEGEEYTVFLNWSGSLIDESTFSFAKDGSTAYT